jgi:leucyl aminopeptidase
MLNLMTININSEVNESMWKLPLKRIHRQKITSTVADLTNAPKGDRFGGASNAAAFLEAFVNQDTKWVHIDIAGPSTKGSIATGFSTQTVLNYLIRESDKIKVEEKDEISNLKSKRI